MGSLIRFGKGGGDQGRCTVFPPPLLRGRVHKKWMLGQLSMLRTPGYSLNPVLKAIFEVCILQSTTFTARPELRVNAWIRNQGDFFTSPEILMFIGTVESGFERSCSVLQV